MRIEIPVEIWFIVGGAILFVAVPLLVGGVIYFAIHRFDKFPELDKDEHIVFSLHKTRGSRSFFVAYIIGVITCGLLALLFYFLSEYVFKQFQ